MVWPKCPQTETARPKRPERNGQTETARAKRPERNGQIETGQTETTQTESVRLNRLDGKVAYPSGTTNLSCHVRVLLGQHLTSTDQQFNHPWFNF